jgi:lipid II:glycine glycyltransferase (peptidoglycan interpeptide bridge formation enzyme)
MTTRKFRALVPIMEVNSVLTGKKGVSLPFTDYCEPIIEEGRDSVDLFRSITEFGRRRGWKYIEFRGGSEFFRNLSLRPSAAGPVGGVPHSSSVYVGHTIDLTGGEEKIFANLRDSTRRNIKKAMGQGVTVKITNSPGAIGEFCRLNRMSRKRHGLPPQPSHFFQRIYDHVIGKNNGHIALASHNGQSIAGSVCFHFGGKGIYKYGASDMKFQALRANNLVLWEEIRWLCRNGYESFCFGRTELENEGLQQFKGGWGAAENSIRYFTYDLNRNIFVSNNKYRERRTRNILLNRILQRTPIPILNFAGSLLYRHMG